MQNRINPSNWHERPSVVIWEVTRSCALACRHCRAEAKKQRDPVELSTEEAYELIDEIAAIAPEVFVLTGGDPMNRPDLREMIEYASLRGLRVALSPSATPKFLTSDLNALRRAGLKRLSLSIDGATAETHDAFRGIKGTWNWTMQAIEAGRAADIEIQINTTITRSNIDKLDAFLELWESIPLEIWSVFLLVPTGRGRSGDLPEPLEVEQFFRRLADLAQTLPYGIKTTEGQHFRRVAIQRWTQFGGASKPRMFGTNDGKGFVFVSHTGDIQPSGFLPLTAGNVRIDNLAATYRDSVLFRDLRNPDLLQGKCGRCSFRSICGGSRARAYAMTGDHLNADPLCPFIPAKRPQALYS